jgi:hypothetical protein
MTRQTALKTVANFLGKALDANINSFEFGGNDITLASLSHVWKLTYEDAYRVADVIKSKQFDEKLILAKFNNKFLSYTK